MFTWILELFWPEIVDAVTSSRRRLMTESVRPLTRLRWVVSFAIAGLAFLDGLALSGWILGAILGLVAFIPFAILTLRSRHDPHAPSG